ncbi:MAG TPA: hypothetical protein DEH25_16720 [Chloroflexi bacterium]|nr:hypothetical protein [Chloroflexota bacterium]HBY06775.1 hypothetical protein [Chloroflexota bacterium]
MTTPILFYAISILSVLMIGISKSGFGSALAVFGVPLMSMVMPPAQAAAIVLPLLILMDLFNLFHYRRQYDRKNLLILLPASIVGIVIGTLTFRYLTDAHIRIMIGSIGIIFALFYIRGQRKEQSQAQPDPVRGSFWGVITGFTSFGIHAGGIPVNIYLLPQRMDKTLLVGTTVILFAILNWIKLIPYALLGQLQVDNLLISLILAPFVPIGFWLGIKLHDRVNEKLFYNLAYFFLFVTGVKLLYDGLMQL